MLSFYIHIPFCPSKCRYCDFFSGVKPVPSVIAAYLDALKRELSLFHQVYPQYSVLDTVYIGGGSPSILSADDIAMLLESVRSEYQIAPDAEITLEANPEDVNPEKSAIWFASGINRVSLGFQSMNVSMLKRMNRRNTPWKNTEAFGMLRSAGFENISVDLISCIPYEAMSNNLHKVVMLEPDHISVYQLTLSENSQLYQDYRNGDFVPLKEDRMMIIQDRCERELSKCGFRRYEVSNYARNDSKQSRHNKAYWDYEEYIGIGAGATGTIRSGNREWLRWKNAEDVPGYICAMQDGRLHFSDVERINASDAMKEFVMLGLRKTDGFSFTRFRSLFGVDFRDVCSTESMNSTLNASDEGIALNRRGMEVANSVTVGLWEAMENKQGR